MTRFERYQQKLDYITYKLETLPTEPSNDIIADAILYRLQTSIEAVMDIIAMLCKDLSIPIGDDYTNIENLEESKIIAPELGDKLKRLNGLRNALVHRYNRLDFNLIFDNVEEVKEILMEFVEVMDDLLREIFK